MRSSASMSKSHRLPPGGSHRAAFVRVLFLCAAIPIGVYVIRVATFAPSQGLKGAALLTVEGDSSSVATAAAGGGGGAPLPERQIICRPGPIDIVDPPPCDKIEESTRWYEACNPTKSEPDYPFLLTGTGGTLQLATFDWLHHFKIKINRDNKLASKDFGTFSWVLAFNDFENYPSFVSQFEENEGITFRHVVLQARDPLHTISERSMKHLDRFIEYHVEDAMPRSPDPDTHLLRALMHYVAWHEHLLDVASYILRVEDADMTAMCNAVGFGDLCPSQDLGDKEWRDLRRKYEERENAPETSWAELDRIEPSYARRARAIAERLGYCTSDVDPNPTKFKDTFAKAKDSGRKKSTTVHAARAHHIPGLSIDRLHRKRNPILKSINFYKHKLEEDPGSRIDGPAIIEVPSWVKKPLGKFYLYSSHPLGQYIRFSYASRIDGPYTTTDEGILQVPDIPFCGSHIANPHAVVDEDTQRVLLYFHCGVCASSDDFECGVGGEVVFVATSSDGKNFEPVQKVLGRQFLRVNKIGSYFYLAGKDTVWASPDGINDFEVVGHVFPRFPVPFQLGDYLFLVWASDGVIEYSRVDISDVDTSKPMSKVWKEFPQGLPLVEPEADWEMAPNNRGSNVRDPFPLVTSDGKVWLAYSAAGQRNIGLVQVIGLDSPDTTQGDAPAETEDM